MLALTREARSAGMTRLALPRNFDSISSRPIGEYGPPRGWSWLSSTIRPSRRRTDRAHSRSARRGPGPPRSERDVARPTPSTRPVPAQLREHCEHRVVDAAVARHQRWCVEIEGAAVEIRDAPAGLLDEQAAGRDVPRPEAQLPVAVEPPAGE